MQFTKLHGLGNDYLYFNTLAEDLSGCDLPALSRVLSDRHFGPGADGIILVEPSTVADFRMRIFNADGSEAEMCGNGVRAFAKYVYDHGLSHQTELSVETAAGVRTLDLQIRDGKMAAARVDMGAPHLARKDIPMRGEPADQPVVGENLTCGKYFFQITAVSMGNPHCVIFLPEIANFPVTEVGPVLEHHQLFPNRTNVEFARIVDRKHIDMRVWERGSGETMACGTGACATAVAGALTGRANRDVTVHLLGGDLEIEWADNDHVMLTGPATEVYTAEVEPGLLATVGKHCR